MIIKIKSIVTIIGVEVSVIIVSAGVGVLVYIVDSSVVLTREPG